MDNFHIERQQGEASPNINAGISIKDFILNLIKEGDIESIKEIKEEMRCYFEMKIIENSDFYKEFKKILAQGFDVCLTRAFNSVNDNQNEQMLLGVKDLLDLIPEKYRKDILSSDELKNELKKWLYISFSEEKGRACISKAELLFNLFPEEVQTEVFLDPNIIDSFLEVTTDFFCNGYARDVIEGIFDNIKYEALCSDIFKDVLIMGCIKCVCNDRIDTAKDILEMLREYRVPEKTISEIAQATYAKIKEKEKII